MALGAPSGKRPSRKFLKQERAMIARLIEEGIENFKTEYLGKEGSQMKQKEIDKAMPNFQDKIPVIKAYIWDLAQLYCMRSQIAGNVMSDADRLAIGLFRRWSKPERLDLLQGMVDDIDGILMGAFRDRMLEKAHKSEPTETGSGGSAVGEPESKAGSAD